MKPLYRSEQGASAVEFALVLPILIFITFAIIEFGILLFDKAVITNASREGARYGIVFKWQYDAENGNRGEYKPVSVDSIKEKVTRYTKSEDGTRNLLINLGSSNTELQNNDITVSCKNFGTAEWTAPPCSQGQDLRVNVTFTYDFLVLPNLAKLLNSDDAFDGTFTLQAQTIMRMEGEERP